MAMTEGKECSIESMSVETCIDGIPVKRKPMDMSNLVCDDGVDSPEEIDFDNFKFKMVKIDPWCLEELKNLAKGYTENVTTKVKEEETTRGKHLPSENSDKVQLVSDVLNVSDRFDSGVSSSNEHFSCVCIDDLVSEWEKTASNNFDTSSGVHKKQLRVLEKEAANTKCCECEYTFPDIKDLLLHIKQKHPKSTVFFADSGLAEKLKANGNKCEIQANYVQELSELDAAGSDSAARSVNNSTGSNRFGNNDSSRTAGTPSSIRAPTLKCSKCPQVFLYGTALEDHMKEVHPENGSNILYGNIVGPDSVYPKPYFQCSKCQQTFQQSSSLENHVREMHTECEYIRCEYIRCEYRPGDENQMKEAHAVNENAAGNNDYGAMETTRPYYYVRTIKCKRCSRAYQYGKDFEQHMKEIHPDCSCDIVYGNVIRSADLKFPRSFECSKCQRRFLQIGFLENHARRRHPECEYVICEYIRCEYK